MAAEIEVKYALPGAQYIESMLRDELTLKYVKDAFRTKESCSEYYDTHAWELSAASYELRITRSEEPKVAVLKQGAFRDEDMPGLYRGSRWLAPYGGLDTVLSDLIERGAPREIAALAGGKPLELSFYTILSRRYATLYMPDRTRVELCFDVGELIADGKRMPLYELGLELLYGSEDLLLDYCRQLRERFALSPLLLSRHERALRLLRTRR
jgi:triphosphatase